jgi:hypothetical protein
MDGPRERARRNLVVFWLVVIGLPILIFWGCVTFDVIPSQMG